MQAAGATAGTIAMSATYPLDMVRGRLTVQLERTGQYTGILNAAQSIVRQVGASPTGAETASVRPDVLGFQGAAQMYQHIHTIHQPGQAVESRLGPPPGMGSVSGISHEVYERWQAENLQQRPVHCLPAWCLPVLGAPA